MRPPFRLSRGPARRAGLALAVALAALVQACAVGGPPPPGATGALPPAAGEPGVAAPSGAAGAETAGTRRSRASAKVVMLLPLSGSGQTALVAKALKQAGEMALFERDSPGFQLIVKDDRGTPEGARAAAEEAVKEGAELIVGPLLARSVSAVAPLAREARVPVIAFSNDRQVAGNGVWLVSFLLRQEVERVVGYSAGQGRRRIAALIGEDAYGDLAERALREAAEAHRATVAVVERYKGEGTAMLEPAKRLVEAIRESEGGPGAIDAVFLPGGPETLSTLGPLVAYASIDTERVKLIGTGGWDVPSLGRDKTFHGGWYPSPDPRGWRAFAERFAKAFGTAPPRIASLAFDAVTIAIELAEQGPAGARFAPSELTRASGFNGVDGPLRLLPDGTSERGLAILEVQAFGATVVDPPPAAFARAAASSPPLR
jgi:ABC-type branched-subunit amino acid transport system substrate-binding protein